MLCETCKHWGEPVKDINWDDEERFPGMRECDRIPFGPDLLKDMPGGRYGAALPAEQLACTMDGSGYTGALYTRAAFGCVLHEAK